MLKYLLDRLEQIDEKILNHVFVGVIIAVIIFITAMVTVIATN